MAKKKQQARKAAIKAASSGQLTNKVLRQAKKAGVSSEALNRARTIQARAQGQESAAPRQPRQEPTRITKEKTKQVLQKSGGDIAKAVDRLAKKDLSLGSGAANMLMRIASKGGVPQAGAFGTSGLGQYLQGMAGTAGLVGPRNPQSGAPSYKVPGIAGAGKVPRGMEILPGGRNLGIRQRPQVSQTTSEVSETTSGGGGTSTYPSLDEINASIQKGIDAGIAKYIEDSASQYNPALEEIAGLKDMLTISDQRAADLSNVFNTELMRIQQGYADQVALGIQQQQQQEAENRAYLMNQFRMGTRPDLRGVQTFNPQLAGTQGFKFRPQPTFMAPAQVASAFTAPTTATTAPVNQVLNI